MNESRLLWPAAAALNLYVSGAAYTWWRWGWRWSVGLFIGAPLALVVLGALTLVVIVVIIDAQPRDQRSRYRKETP